MQKVIFPCLFFLASLCVGTAKAQTSVRSSTYPLLAMWSFRELAQIPTPQGEVSGIAKVLSSSDTSVSVEVPAEMLLSSEASAPAESPMETSVSFSTERLGAGVLLKWNLSQREAVTSLVIETSEDGEVFTDLEALHDAEAGAVNVYYDAEPQTRRFYRIVANYRDGRQHITPAGDILPVAAPAPDFSAAFESEDVDLLTVRSVAPVEIYDLTGKRLFTAPPAADSYLLDFTGLPANEHYLVRAGDHRQMVFYKVETAMESSKLPEAL